MWEPRQRKAGRMFRLSTLRDPTAFDNPTRTILQKLADFIRKLVGLVKTHGAQDVMNAISSGQMASRSVGYGGLGPRGLSRRSVLLCHSSRSLLLPRLTGSSLD